jgi:integrase
MGELTALQVKHAGKPGGKLGAGKHHDGNGLYLEVRNANSKSWVGRYTLKGKEIWPGIGPVKGISLERARELNEENHRLVAEGIDPREHRKAQRAAAAAAEAAKTVIFEEMAKQYIASHEAGWKNAKHRRDWPNSLKTYAHPIIGQLPVQAIDNAAAMRVLQQLLDGTTFWLARPETASRVRGRCERIWAAAKAQRLCSGENPFDWKTLKHLLPATSKVRRVKHHAAVPWREIPSVGADLRTRWSVSARCLEFTLLTVPRTSEVLAAPWGEFDLDHGVWTIPGERMKAGREHRVPLSSRALEIVKQQLPKEQPKPDALVWDLSDAALTKMLRLIGRTETVHGLRSSFRDWVAEATDFQRELAEVALAHVVGDETERAYQRGDLFEKRKRLMQAWCDYCTPPVKRSTPAEQNNVTLLRQAGKQVPA